MSILELIFIPFFNVIEWVFSVVPRLVFPESFTTAVDTLVDLILNIGFFVPLATIADIMLLYITWYFVKLGIKLFLFVVRKIPILGVN